MFNKKIDRSNLSVANLLLAQGTLKMKKSTINIVDLSKEHYEKFVILI